ncbi:hypothetical protein Rhopal_004943-T1 [Rhodotorula paludigena]|uniref:Uncharacterized protein n=1 Tax=Rhodotorula paludigena TaxID=86838 RepID=A0AAV5GP28_9BASI|nr:hypothetical protein Rhopal_004943-T1 [Rhodotorula paludigena]
MDFSNLLNPSSDPAPRASGSGDPAPLASRMALNSLLSAPGAAMAAPGYAFEDTAAFPGAGGFAPSAFELHPPASPLTATLDPLAALDPQALAAQVRSAMGPPPVVRGASPVSTASVVPDSDDEGALRRAERVAGKAPVKLEDDAEVDIMANGDEGATLAALKTQPRPSSATPKPRSKASSSKGKARAHLASTGTSPAPSPGPSGLSQELLFDSTSLSALTASSAGGMSGPPLSPSAYVHPRLDPSLPRATLPAAFEAYAPPRRATFGVGDDDSDSEDEDARRKERQRRAAMQKGKSKAKAKEDEEDDSEVDDRLYCICKELYDPEPVAPLSKYCTDYCGVAVAAARLELLQVETGAAPDSFYDAVRKARRREADTADAAAPGQLDRAALDTLPVAEQNAQRGVRREAEFARQDAADARTRSRLVARLRETDERRAALRGAVGRVELRLVYLRVAVQRWEKLCADTARALIEANAVAPAGEDADEAAAAAAAAAAGNSRKGKRKGKGSGKKKGPTAPTSLPEAQCGLDVRLCFSDAEWRAWCVGDEGRAILEAAQGGDVDLAVELDAAQLDHVCLTTRKECNRHQGWQKVREADFALEKAVFNRRLERLDVLSHSLGGQLAQHDETVAFRLANRSRTADDADLIGVEDLLVEREEARAAAVASSPPRRTQQQQQPRGNRGRETRSPSLHANGNGYGGESRAGSGDYEELLMAGLSRSELRQLRRQGG